jgi:hypothetical protein
MTAPAPNDPAYLDLSRQLYWAQGPGKRREVGTKQVREDMLEFVAKMRTDERAKLPLGEPHLSSPVRWRRKLKYKMFGLTRFQSRRYDRLIGDAMDITVALAERVIDLEQEVASLRARLEDADGGAPS